MSDTHWRNTQKVVRMSFLDARVSAFLLLFLVYMRVSTLVLFIFVMIFFWILERRGLSFDSAIRAMRRWILGAERPATSSRSQRFWVEYPE